ncbi:amino acid permease [Corynebacterium liangguodongii]|uniref:amino acid permease n=1 Tax=Corynebacterium liangguodongii TaxID=2079535 RepID=UPI0015D0C77D|nr:amino acid permease [Corynebacterium liangguodongii]
MASARHHTPVPRGSSPHEAAPLPALHSAEHLRQSREEFHLDNLTPADVDHIRLNRRGSAPNGTFLSWVITLFGTAVGAGILFLPLNAGSFGFWPLVIATALIGPLVFFSHRMYARIVSASPVKGLDVLQVVTALSGRKRGVVTAVMYWLAIYPTVLIYAISMTNTMESFLVNQIGLAQVNRVLLAIACVGLLTGAFALGKKATLWFANILVYPLIVALAGVSFYLVPRWDLASFRSYESATPLWQSLLLILPVLVFSFSHMAAVSQFALDVQKAKKGDVAATERQVSRIELITTALLVAFTMFFVWSCTLALGAKGLEEAAAQNLPVLSYFANVTNTPFMAVITPVVAICAIASSFFGHLLGTEEGTTYLVRVIAPRATQGVSDRVLRYGVIAFVFVTGVLVAVLNPSILDLISVIGGIFMTFLVYLVPFLLFRKAKAFAHYAHRPDALFVGFMGAVIMAVSVWEMFR